MLKFKEVNEVRETREEKEKRSIRESNLSRLAKEKEGEIEMNENILDRPIVKEISNENKGEVKMEAKDYLGYLLDNKNVNLDGDEKIIMDAELGRINDEVDINAVLYFEQNDEDDVIKDVLEDIPEVGKIWMEKMIRLGWTLGQINYKWYQKLKSEGKEKITYKDINSYYSTNEKRRAMFNEAMRQTMILKRQFEEVLYKEFVKNNAM